ncbi:OspG family effector kinase [Yersinia hibernica]|uniref:Kinase OspG kinase domain-containing protein n=1 Tax=Yersinia enterocolitica LC20 TaxID=1443113 RepID=A0A7U4JZU0_YEREN|nr:hypothetical protein [Yersinia hibernica]AHM71701.2 hypothetical protein LC20_00445 [Yersinia hibernica]OVZ78741.1 hypothetical protein CBW54_19850 [Yersinia kristensenii]
MLKKTQLCLWIAVLFCSALFAEEPPPFTPPTINRQHTDSFRLPLKVTARDHLLLEAMADKLPNVSSTSDPVFSQAMQLIDNANELEQEIWLQQFGQISDARVGRIVDLYLQLYDVQQVESAESLEDLLHLRAELTAEQGYQKARIASLERDVLFKLFQKGLMLSTEEQLTPLAALNLVWWLHQENPPTLTELSAGIYRPEYKERRIQAAILYNYSHYGQRYGEVAGGSAEQPVHWARDSLDGAGLPVFRAVQALRVLHEGMTAIPAVVQSDESYLGNGFAPKNAQGRYLTGSLMEMTLTGCSLVGFDICSQQDFAQFLDLQYPVGSLAFSLKATFNLYYRLQGKDLDQLEGKDTEQLYNLLLEEEQQLQQTGVVGYSPTVIFLSHFSQSNGAEVLTVKQMASAFNRIAESIAMSGLSESALITFSRLKQLAGNIIDDIAIDLEQERFVSDLKAIGQLLEYHQPALYLLVQHALYHTEREKIARELDYLDMRLAYRHPPDEFDENQAIKAILLENGVRNINVSRQYIYHQDARFGFPQKKFDSPVDEFKRRRNASDHFVANMSMLSSHGKLINVFKSLDAKKNQYFAQIKTHPAIRAKAIEMLIDSGQQPQGMVLQLKINSLAQAYQPESENTRFWGNAWESLENHWVCKLPQPNPMCTIAKVEGPRYRNDKENMAAGMTAMVMEVSLLRGAGSGVKMVEHLPPGADPLLSPTLSVAKEDLINPKINGIEDFNPEVNVPELETQEIENPRGALIEVQRIALKDAAAVGEVRQAWVRQGGSGAYWEVDLVTGHDLGFVLKQGPQFIRPGRLLGGGPFQSRFSHPQFNPEIKLGTKIGRGVTGDVYLDANNRGFVLKKLAAQNQEVITDIHVKEVEFFNRYYGEGAAELIAKGNQYYIRMYRVPGETLTSIKRAIFPPSAKERFLSMMDDLGYHNIIHDDLNFNNVLYDEKTNTFYPIDFDKAYDGYHSARGIESSQQHWGVDMRISDILEYIDEYKKN